MSVYVDPLFFHTGSRTRSQCHMYADTIEELQSMAETLKLDENSFQDASAIGFPQYELTRTQRGLAVQAGAIQHSSSQRLMFKRRLAKFTKSL